MRVWYAVSPIGLGHASRSLAIALKLREKGFKIEFFTGGNAVKFLSYHNFRTIDFHTNIPYFKVSNKGELKGITRWMINYIRFYKKMKKKARKYLEKKAREIDLVISDEDFAFANEAIELGIKTIFITDLIQTHFAKNFLARAIERRTNEWFKKFYERCPLIIVPEDEGEVIGNMQYIGPIARELTKSRDQVREELGVGKKDNLILVTTGGSPIGSYLFEAVRKFLNNSEMKNITSIFVGKTATRYMSNRIKAYDLYMELQNIVASSDLVITTAGKSTIDECRIYGINCIAIPIKGHFEQERNASKLGFKYEDIYNLDELIGDYLEKPSPRPVKNNLDKAIKLIIKNM